MLAKISALRSSCQCLLLAALISLVFFAPGRSAAGQPAKQPAAPTSMGELKIEGKLIEELTLERKPENRTFDPSNTIVLNRLGATVSLPAGTYRVKAIELQGGYLCVPPATGIVEDPVVGRGAVFEDWFALTPDKPHVLKLGAPLKPTVTADRLGGALWLSYRLEDADGRWYVREKADKPPRFAVYQGDRIIGSDTFEFG